MFVIGKFVFVYRLRKTPLNRTLSLGRGSTDHRIEIQRLCPARFHLYHIFVLVCQRHGCKAEHRCHGRIGLGVLRHSFAVVKGVFRQSMYRKFRKLRLRAFQRYDLSEQRIRVPERIVSEHAGYPAVRQTGTSAILRAGCSQSGRQVFNLMVHLFFL